MASTASGLGASQAGAPGGPPGRELPGRRAIRTFLDKMKVEFAVIGVVIVYMVLVFADLMLNEEDGIPWWNPVFQVVDLGFLIAFTLELLVRLYAYGLVYVKDALNMFDAIVVLVSLVLQIFFMLQPAGTTATSSFGFMRIVRLIRLVRLFTVMNKLQKARSAYKKAKYLRIGTPVEKVMELLGQMRETSETDEDGQDVAWIMDLIATDKLYTIDVRKNTSMSAEMSAFITANLGLKNEDPDDDTATDAGSTTTASSGGAPMLRQESSYLPAAAEELTRCQELVERPEVAELLKHIADWEFDPFAFVEATQGNGLVVAAYHLIDHYGLIDKMRLSRSRLASFLHQIQEGYRGENPYHNATHALDVLLNMNYFLTFDALGGLLKPVDRLACLLAAAVHDFEHPGLNNNFLAATKDPLAITYNDRSILESHHVAASFKLLLSDECNFTRQMGRDAYAELRATVIQLVLGTDMKYHFEHVTKFKTKLSSNAFKHAETDSAERSVQHDDVKFLLAVALHSADIANPAKPTAVCSKWTELVMEEFFLQGDKEASLGMPVSPFYDREKTNVAQCQMGFINVLVKPLYVEFTSILGDKGISECLRCLESNFDGWTEYQRRCTEDGATEPWTEFMATRAKELADERARLNRRPSLAASLSGRAGAQVHPQ